jgi:predicted O-methyltransferase YrrM
MAFSTRVKEALNATLAPLNLKLDSLTAERAELLRQRELERSGHFDRAICPVPSTFGPPPDGLIQAIREGESRFDSFESPDRNPVGYSFDNAYFSSPDAEALYGMIRWRRPARYLEIGSGHSTRVARQAISDGNLTTRVVCVDPSPRLDVARLADEVHEQRIERIEDGPLSELGVGDILFIDSSHEIRPGNDVVHLLLRVLPTLPPGTLVHIHDVFLPFDYPRDWVVGKPFSWSEQYLVAALLDGNDRLRVLWPGYWLQKTWPGFSDLLPHARGRRAQSLWLSVEHERR